MNNCNCSPISPIADPALKLEKFDFARVLRTLLTEAAQGSVSGAEPLENLDPPMRSLDRVVLESWPYIAALLSTYDAAIAAESYIPTAVMSLNGFIDILGYQPRPATASQGPVVAHVQKHSVDIGEGATFRAASADLEAQQVCAVTSPSSTSITLNTGVVSPIREAGTQPRLLLEAATAAPVRGNIVLFLWKDKLLRMHATEILAVTLTPGVDGSPYVQIDVSESPSISGDTTWENVSVLSPSQRAYALTAIFELAESAVTDGGTIDEGDESYEPVLNLFMGGYIGAVEVKNLPLPAQPISSIFLDGSYRSMVAGDLVVVQNGGLMHSARVVTTGEVAQPLKDNGAVKIPATMLTVAPALPAGFVTKDTTNRLVIHYNFHDIGRLTRPAKHLLAPADLVNTPEAIPLEGLYDPPPPGLEPKELILEDANGLGVLVQGTLAFADDGSATMSITAAPNWHPDTRLRVPVRVHGNVLHVSVGETVRDEVLGDGDASIPFQSFDLKKSPLTYLTAPGTPRGVASTLEVRVAGILYREVPTFFKATPTDRVYIVRHDEEQNTTITFGDGIRGARLPTGKSNVRATYRFGAGGAPIPAGSVTQILRGAPGLVRVRNPAPLTGGSDREGPKQLRKNGPASALILGRLVGLADFGARAQSFSGVLQSKVERTWDKRVQSAVAKVWFIAKDTGGEAELAVALRRDLEALSEEGTLVEAAPAERIEKRLRVVVVVDPAYRDEDVTAAVYAILTDPEDGLLAVANARIGGTLMRAEIAAAVRSVAGVLDIGSLDLAEGPFPAPGLRAPDGAYHDFLGPKGGATIIEALSPEQRPCTEIGS